MKPKYRLPFAVFSNILEVCLIVLLVKYVLPLWGVSLPLWSLALVIAAWITVSVLIYRCSSRALERKLVTGLPDMAGLKGIVVKDINPEGTVKIMGELWRARSEHLIETGREVEVVCRQGMTLVVCIPGQSI
jgi:membrane-bound ClpP family serine protease